MGDTEETLLRSLLDEDQIFYSFSFSIFKVVKSRNIKNSTIFAKKMVKFWSEVFYQKYVKTSSESFNVEKNISMYLFN